MLARRALPSALRQEGVRLEVIVVDDGSAEPAPANVSRGDERVRVVRHEQSRGVPAARNAGIAAARGEWTAFLDDDDLWAPQKLRAQIDRAHAQGASLAYSAVVHTNLRGDVLALDPAPPGESLPDLLRAGHVIPAAASNLVARTGDLREIGGFDEHLFILEDPDLAIRLVQRGRAANCEDVHVAYLQHERARHLRDIDRLLTSFDRFRTRHPEISGFLLENHLDWVLMQHRHAGRKLAAARLCWTVARHERSARWLLRGLVYLAGNRARHGARRLKALALSRGRLEQADRRLRSDDVDHELDWLNPGT